MKILAVDDGGFKSQDRDAKQPVAILSLVTGDKFEIVDLKIGNVTIDGLDATSQILCDHSQIEISVDIVLLPSITLAGFNIVNIEQLSREMGVPIIVANPQRPHELAIRKALILHFKDWKERLASIQRSGSPVPIELTKGRSIYVQWAGASLSHISRVVRDTTIFGNRPEPLRAARLLVHGLTTPLTEPSSPIQ